MRDDYIDPRAEQEAYFATSMKARLARGRKMAAAQDGIPGLNYDHWYEAPCTVDEHVRGVCEHGPTVWAMQDRWRRWKRAQ